MERPAENPKKLSVDSTNTYVRKLSKLAPCCLSSRRVACSGALSAEPSWTSKSSSNIYTKFGLEEEEEEDRGMCRLARKVTAAKAAGPSIRGGWVAVFALCKALGSLATAEW